MACATRFWTDISSDLDVFCVHSLARLYTAIGEKIPEIIIQVWLV